MVNKEGNWILQIGILHEEKHLVDDGISLSSDENNRARSPQQCDIDLLASTNLKPSWPVGKLE